MRALTIAVQQERRGEKLGALRPSSAPCAAGFSFAQGGNAPDLVATVNVETGTARVAGGFVTLHSPDAVRLTRDRLRRKASRSKSCAPTSWPGGIAAGDLEDLMQSLVNSRASTPSGWRR
ncbi:MAG: hypothetical protein U0359_41765 [Byssovorax sp.]